MSSGNRTFSTHIVACPIGDTGHLRPTLALLTNIIRSHPCILITLFVLKTLVAKVNDDLARSGCPDVNRIRIIGVSDINFTNGSDRVFVGTAIDEISKLVPEAYEVLVAGGTVTCTATGSVYDYTNIPRPALALVDVLASVVGNAIKRITPDIKLLAVASVPPSFYHLLSGPKDQGGLGQWNVDIEELMEADNSMSFTEAAMSVITPTGKEHPNLEGVKMYDYELMPQMESTAGDVIQTSLDAARHVNVVADGVILPITEGWEPKTAQLLRRYYEEGLGKHLFFVGQRYQSKRLDQNPANDPVMISQYPEIFKFLGAQKLRSVWLIAFGSVYYPYAHPEQLYAVMRTLVKKRTPFVLARSGLLVQKAAPIPQDILEEVEKSGLGLIVNYVPQEAVLNHPNMGAFLTHGGMNSLQETVQAGVMPILWPFNHDQPFNAAYLSQELDCAFELIQVRTGPGAQPPYRGGTVVGTEEAIGAEVANVIEGLRGEVGARKRRNFDNFRARFMKELGDDGAVHKALHEIITLAASSAK